MAIAIDTIHRPARRRPAHASPTVQYAIRGLPAQAASRHRAPQPVRPHPIGGIFLHVRCTVLVVLPLLLGLVAS